MVLQGRVILIRYIYAPEENCQFPNVALAPAVAAPGATSAHAALKGGSPTIKSIEIHNYQ